MREIEGHYQAYGNAVITTAVLKSGINATPWLLEHGPRELEALRQSIHFDSQTAASNDNESSDRAFALYLLDLEGNIASWCSNAERMHAYKSDDVIGEHFSILSSAVHPNFDNFSLNIEELMKKAVSRGHAGWGGWNYQKRVRPQMTRWKSAPQSHHRFCVKAFVPHSNTMRRYCLPNPKGKERRCGLTILFQCLRPSGDGSGSTGALLPVLLDHFRAARESLLYQTSIPLSI